MIEKRTVVDQIEIARSGYVQIRFGLLLVDDGNEINCKWHRTAIEPGGNVDAQIAVVNSHLAAMGKSPVGQADIDRIKSFAKVAHTPDVVAAFVASQKA